MRAAIAGLIALMSLQPLHAQRSILFEHLTVKQGLSQAAVMCSLQDSRGFIWFGTQDGLNRYDGYECKVFKHNPSDSSSLNDNFIALIAETADHTLWIGTISDPQFLNRFDRLTASFSQVPRDSVDLSSARVSEIHPTYRDSFGEIWSGDIRKGLTRTDPRTGTKIAYHHDPKNPNSLIDDRIYSVVGDRHGEIWIGTHEGLDRYDRQTDSFVHYRHEDNNPKSLSDNWVWPILEDQNGTLWVGTFRGGLNRFDPATETFTRFRHNEANPRGLSDDLLYSLYQDRSGMIWAGTGNHGVDRFNPEGGAFANYTHDATSPTSLINDNIIAVFVDRSGKPWIGTRLGLDVMDRASGIFRHFQHNPADPRSIGDNQVQSIFEDRSGVLWIGTNTAGLDRFDPRTGSFSHFSYNSSDPHSLSDNSIQSLCEDRLGDLWVGSYTNGLNRFDRKTGTFTRFMHLEAVPGSLGGRGVWTILEDHAGTLWVGTSGGGLDRFNRERQTFDHFRHDDANPKSLSDDAVISLYEDRSGRLWVGTSGGLNRFDSDSGSFKRYREKDGLANDFVFGILEDDRGNLWMSTNKGLSRFDPRTETFRNYDYSDGLQGNEFNQGAYARDPQTGELFFGGSNGFNVFQPDSVRNNTYVPPVVFSAFSRYNSDDEKGTPIDERGIDAKPEIRLSYKDNVANFEFAALNFHNTFRNEYAYKLEGYTDNWIQLGTDHRATFTNLDGGEYTLRVRGSNNDGVWNEEGASLRLIVTPPWWKTHWAYGTYLVLTLYALYGVRRFEINRQAQKTALRESQLRTRAAEAEKRALEAENERKTKELEDARHLQLSLLPKDVPHIPPYDIAVFMKTATEVGGDYYDFSVAQDGTLNVAFGDATGHGMQAGTIVTLMKGLFVSDAARSDIKTFFNHCSNAIKEIRLGRLFMAFTLVRLKGSSVSFSSAGMPPVFLYRSDSGTVEEILVKGMPLGAMKNYPYGLFEADLRPGDTVLLLSDGLPEQKNAAGEMFDYSRVQGAFAAMGTRKPDEIIQHLVQQGETWMDGAEQEDDVTMMVIRIQG